MTRRFLWIFMITCANPSIGFTAQESSGGPYCGIYCLYAAAKSVGLSVAIEELVSDRYITSDAGSTIADLMRAGYAIGLHAQPLSSMSVDLLQSIQSPVILHVRRPGYRVPYAHWSLYLGVQDGQARILDPPGEVILLPFAELAAMWDGIGIVVSREPISATSLTATSMADSLLAPVLLVVVWLIVRLRFPGLAGEHSISKAFLPLLIGFLAVLMLTALDPHGLLHNREARATVAGQYFRQSFPEIDRDAVRERLRGKAVTVVDARLQRDYSHGHLPGAISLPITASINERREVAAAIPAGHEVIVFCQSDGCVWSDAIASDLYHRGHRQIRIYRGGWIDWSRP